MKLHWLFLFLPLLLITVSCSQYDKLLKDGSSQERLAKANELYEKGVYFKAIQLYDQLIVEYRGKSEFEDIYYRYAYCYFKQEQYLMAAHYFSSLARTLPNSKYAEEAFFMGAYCQYLESAEPSLDQTSTTEALTEFQLFVNKYPSSERVKQCNDLMDELRLKLETKAFNLAKLYFQVEEYKAAIVALNNVLKDYPGSQYKEEILFLVFKSNYYYANGSIAAKQRERFAAAETAYKKFASSYPDSKYMREAANLNDRINLQLSKLN
ncbi:MAG: outer membrane protein assembly factor BamD [Bacteroidetes bacterium HGW-Bacteroidetes-6]|nr:MAG: outer membrane protein assembly factor BamD [Bacteroidetes bacterium HGW-Bacteroidetes-6]